MNRRTALRLGVAAAFGAVPLPRAFAAPFLPGPQPVPGDALAGCVNSWRQDLPALHWDAALAPACLDWAQHQAALYQADPDGFTYLHSKAWPGQECIWRGEGDWGMAFDAWVNSPAHLGVLRHTRATRVGMAGFFVEGTPRYGNCAYFVLRVKEEE